MSIVPRKTKLNGRDGLAREQAQNPLEKRRRCGQRVARHSECGLGREHGALRLGFRRGGYAARPCRLHRRGADAASDLADRRDPMVRVPWNMPDIIMKSLDAGAYGVVCPMINTPAECEEFIQNCRYAPRGRRSFGPIRAVMYGGADYWKFANETILTIAMIETQQALDNLDAILKTPGLNSIYVGPSDLGLSLGFQPGPDPTTPKVAEAIKFIVDRAKAASIPAGIHCAAR